MIYGFNDKKETINLLNFFYPVGSVYETADGSFDPNTAWGGTWVQVTGKFLLASGGGYNIGTTGGAATKSYTPAGTVGGHALTVNEMPKHKHTFTGMALTVEITDGESGITNNVPIGPTSEYTSEVGGGVAHSHGFTGTQASINVMPPYEVVNVWKRTA